MKSFPQIGGSLPLRSATVRAPEIDAPDWANIWTAEWHTISCLELIPGTPLSADTWTIPTSWASGGTKKAYGNRTIPFLKALPTGWTLSDARAQHALRRLKRLAVLMFTRSLRMGNQIKNPPKPSTWASHCKALCRAACFALAIKEARAPTPLGSACPDNAVRLFDGLQPHEMEQLANSNVNFAHAVIPRLNALFSHRAFDDWPARDVTTLRCNSEPSRPFNDYFTGQLAHAAVWLSEEVGSDLLACWKEGQNIQSTPTGGKRTSDIKAYRKEWISKWQGKKLSPSQALPFQIRVRANDTRINETGGKVRTTQILNT